MRKSGEGLIAGGGMDGDSLRAGTRSQPPRLRFDSGVLRWLGYDIKKDAK